MREKVIGRTVFGQEVVSPPDDERHDERRELFQLLLALCLHRVSSISITTTDDCVLEVLAEVVLRAKEIGVCEVEQREVFR